MTSRRTAARTPAANAPDTKKLLEQYGCGPIQFTGTADALYERHLLFDNVRTLDRSGPRRPHDRHAILNVAGSGKFSSDRTIAQ